ncbi:MAG: hypothetical protein B7X00_00990 [Legionella sp. 21-45-4]|nr:MAG: hypothetical protein B7X00_00990 [Legionella sp. 21-45-4]
MKYRNPLEVGADRIANSIAATHQFPDTPLIIIDFGTATTFCVLDARKNYLGGAILPGLRLSMETLSNNTAKLPPVDLVRMNEVVGRSTVESIQSGLYYGALGAAREIVTRIKQGILANQNPLVLATGGFAPLFQKENLYDHLLSDLVLHGVRIAMSMQKGKLTN